MADNEDHWHPKIGNPDLYPTFIYVSPGELWDADIKRGSEFFVSLEDMGLHVHLIDPDDGGFSTELFGPNWTIVFMRVPDIPFKDAISTITQHRASIIFDCFFPIMAMENMVYVDSEHEKQVIANRDVMLENLKAACAVTTPHPEWSAALAEVNQNVWTLPDCNSDEDLIQFGITFQEMVGVTRTRCATLRDSGTLKE